MAAERFRPSPSGSVSGCPCCDVIADDEEAVQWLKLARDYADRLQTLPRMPADPQIRPEELKPYLGPWSAYGPDRQGW